MDGQNSEPRNNPPRGAESVHERSIATGTAADCGGCLPLPVRPDMDDFEFDVLLPSQFSSRLGGRAPGKKGEWRLLVAVLQDAIECFQKHLHARGKEERLLFKEAEQWMLGKSEGPVSHAQERTLSFSFQYVCDVLDIDADYVRSGLQRWRAAQPEGADQSSARHLDPGDPTLPLAGEPLLPQPCYMGQPSS